MTESGEMKPFNIGVVELLFIVQRTVKLDSTHRITMSAKRILVISILALFCFSPMQGPLSSHLQADDEVLETSPVSLEILMMGNSYTSANTLDSLVDGVMNAASNPANVTSLTGGGMSLSQHSSNVASSGHQWNTTLNNGA